MTGIPAMDVSTNGARACGASSGFDVPGGGRMPASKM
jgi:hypothetical protein